MPVIQGTVGRVLNWLRDILNAAKAGGWIKQKDDRGGWKR